MKKSLPAIFASVLAAAVMIGTLVGCDGPIVPETKSSSVVTTVPSATDIQDIPDSSTKTTIIDFQTPAVTTGSDVLPPDMSKIVDLSYGADDADKRAAERGWVCLNDYILPTKYDDILSSGEGEGVPEVVINRFAFDRPVKVYGIELTYLNNDHDISVCIDIDDEFIFVLGEYAGKCDGVESLENDRIRFPGNTVWIESATDNPLDKKVEYPARFSIAGDYPNRLVRVRFYGTV